MKRSTIAARNSFKHRLDPISMSWFSDMLRSIGHNDDAQRIDDVTSSHDLVAQLADGVVLCRLVNAVRPNTIKKYNKPKSNMSKFKRLENIQKFTTACRDHLGIPPVSIFTSSDLELGGFGGNGVKNVISTIKHLMDKSNNDSHRESRGGNGMRAAKPSLVTIAGYTDEEECFYMDDYGEVQEVTLSELRELYETEDKEERLLGSTQVSFGEDWKDLSKWLGPRTAASSVPLWKQNKQKQQANSKNKYGGGGFLDLRNGGGINKSTASRARQSSSVSSAETKDDFDPMAEQWYFEDDDSYPSTPAGPFKLDQMQIWYDMGKLRDDQIVWMTINGDIQLNKTEAMNVPILSEEPADSHTSKQGAQPPPAQPLPTGRSPPPRPKTAAPPSLPQQLPTSPPPRTTTLNQEFKEYRRGLLGKFARSRKRHSGKGSQALFRAKNWKRRFFVLRDNSLEYWETRTKFIRRKARSGGILLEAHDTVEESEGKTNSNTRFMFELKRGQIPLLKMFADDDVDRRLWMEALEKCVESIAMSGNPMMG